MDVWKAGPDVYEFLHQTLKAYHLERLYDLEGKIEVVFKEKASTPGGKVVMASTKKVNPMLKVLHGSEALFIFEIAADEWQNMTDKEKLALMDHHLCSISTKESKEGDVTYSVAPPDFVGYRAEIERHGVWRYLNRNDEDDADDVIASLFGKAADPNDED